MEHGDDIVELCLSVDRIDTGHVLFVIVAEPDAPTTVTVDQESAATQNHCGASSV